MQELPGPIWAYPEQYIAPASTYEVTRILVYHSNNYHALARTMQNNAIQGVVQYGDMRIEEYFNSGIRKIK